MSSMLMITGDDFGRSARINQAIASYHAAGALTQASLMVGEPHAEEAVAIAKAHPGLCVGLHLTLCDGMALTRTKLADRHGRLPTSPLLAGLRYAFDWRLRAPLAEEIWRQFKQFRDLGFPPTYWDGHHHLHLHPTILDMTVRIAREFGFRFTRLVREPGPAALLPWVFDRLSNAAIETLEFSEIGFADRVYGLRRTGRVDRRWLKDILRPGIPGVTELYLHPGSEEALPSPAAFAELLGETSHQLTTAEQLLGKGQANGTARSPQSDEIKPVC